MSVFHPLAVAQAHTPHPQKADLRNGNWVSSQVLELWQRIAGEKQPRSGTLEGRAFFPEEPLPPQIFERLVGEFRFGRAWWR